MNIQIDNQNNNGLIGSLNQTKDILGNMVGKMVTGTVSGIGEKASVSIGNREIKVKEEIVAGKKIGDEMQFKVEKADEKNVVLKSMQEFVGTSGASTQKEQLSNLSQLQVQHSTEQFVSVLSDSDLSIDVVGETVEQAKQASNLSSADLKMLRQLGIDVNSADLSHLMGLVNQYHAQQEGRTFQTGTVEVAEQIAKAQSIKPISDGAKRYMMEQQLSFTYENVYKAEYSSSSSVRPAELSEEERIALQPQLESRIKELGFEVTKDTLDAANWLLKNNCDIDTDNMKLYQQIEAFEQNGILLQDYEAALKVQIEVGAPLEEVALTGPSVAQQAQDLVTNFSTVTTEAVENLVQKDIDITPENLFLEQKRLQANTTLNTNFVGTIPSALDRSMVDEKVANDEMQNQNQPQNNNQQSDNHSQGTDEKHMIVEERTIQLFEVRYRLTLNASYQLLHNGIDIKQQDLRDVLKELEQLNQTQTRQLMQDSKVAITQENINLFQQTMAAVNTIPYVPAATLGIALQREDTVTLHNLYRVGIKSASEYAGITDQNGNPVRYETITGVFTSYEEMMTAPRHDMGDSIRKAFSTLHTFLQELGIQPTKENEKAARILSYNQMELTPDNIDKIRTLDERLNRILDTLQPEYVLGMIREGKNPLQMDLTDMEQEIAHQKDIQGEGLEEKYSSFLHQLDKKGEITPEERASFIGIYRMLHTIFQQDTRALGAVVRNNQEITFQNLLSAHRSQRQHGMDVEIDDTYGIVTERFQQGISITDQIDMAFKNMVNDEANGEAYSEQAAEEQLNMEQEEVRRLSNVEREAVEWLNRLDLPNSKSNLLASQQMIEDSFDFYKEMKKTFHQRGNHQDEIFSDMEEAMLERMKLYDEKLTSRIEDESSASSSEHDMDTQKKNLTFSTLEDLFVPAVHAMDENQVFTIKDLQAVRQMHAMTRIADHSVDKDETFFVPVVLQDDIVTMRVKFDHSKEHDRGFTATVNLEQYGTISGKYTIEESGATMQIDCDSESGKLAVQRMQHVFIDSLRQQGIAVDDNSQYNSKTMYETAKAFVTFVKQL